MTLVSVRTTEEHADVHDSVGVFPGYVSSGGVVQGHISPEDIFTGYLFQAVNISGDIDDAIVTVEDLNFGAGGQVDTNVTGDDASADPDVFANGDSPADRTHTTTSVTWDYTPPSGTTFSTPEIKAVVQELFDSYGTLTDVGIFVTGDAGATLSHDMESFDTDSAKAPLLTLNFTAAGVTRRVFVVT